MYVDGLKRHLLETADMDAPTLRGVLVLLYAHDLILMSSTATGLQKQWVAPASLCDQRQIYSQSEQNKDNSKTIVSLKLGIVMLLTLC